jgi:hypothetical protein
MVYWWLDATEAVEGGWNLLLVVCEISLTRARENCGKRFG